MTKSSDLGASKDSTVDPDDVKGLLDHLKSDNPPRTYMHIVSQTNNTIKTHTGKNYTHAAKYDVTGTPPKAALAAMSQKRKKTRRKRGMPEEPQPKPTPKRAEKREVTILCPVDEKRVMYFFSHQMEKPPTPRKAPAKGKKKKKKKRQPVKPPT